MLFNDIKASIKTKCKENGVRFYHGKGKTVRFKDGILSNGYFFDDGDTEPEQRQPVLAIATNDNSLDTLIHESCHMDQYLAQVPVWMNLEGKNQIWQWISGENGFTEQELDESILASYEVELDCEKRSVQKHLLWDTGKDMEEYVQKANAYTLFYFYMRRHRVWYASGREPYNLKEVWTAMPKTFQFDRQIWYNKTNKLFEKCI